MNLKLSHDTHVTNVLVTDKMSLFNNNNTKTITQFCRASTVLGIRKH